MWHVNGYMQWIDRINSGETGLTILLRGVQRCLPLHQKAKCQICEQEWECSCALCTQKTVHSNCTESLRLALVRTNSAIRRSRVCFFDTRFYLLQDEACLKLWRAWNDLRLLFRCCSFEKNFLYLQTRSCLFVTKPNARFDTVMLWYTDTSAMSNILFFSLWTFHWWRTNFCKVEQEKCFFSLIDGLGLYTSSCRIIKGLSLPIYTAAKGTSEEAWFGRASPCVIRYEYSEL